MRLFPTALILSTALLCVAQESIPLPRKDSAPEIPLEPGRPGPGDQVLPTVELGPQTPAPFPRKLAPAAAVKPPAVIRLGPAPPSREASLKGGQFRVHGKLKEQRDNLLREAENTRRMVTTALQLDPVFRFPIVVQIRETQALRPGLPQVWSNIFVTDDGFRFELNLVPLNNSVPGPLLREELVRCILAEMLLRDHAGADLSGRDVPPPDWLLYGLLELLEYQAFGRQSEIFSTVFRLGHVLSVEDIFAASPRHMDSVSRMVYRTSCCGLLLMLLEKQQGKHLAELFKILALMPGDDGNAIARTFPELNASGNSLGKWWSLQLATMAQPGLDELMNTRDTEAELAKALIIQLPPEVAKPKEKKGILSKLFGKKKKEDAAPAAGDKTATAPAPVTAAGTTPCPIDEYTRILARKDRNTILTQAQLALIQLALRAHPLYRPVVGEYLSLVKALAAGKREKEAAATLASLANLRRKLGKDMQAMEDYIDWCEATQPEGMSGAFDDYLLAAAIAAKPPPVRRDAISRYMNLMESEYKVEE